LYRAAGWGRPIVASDLPELRAIAEEERLWVEFFSTGDSNSLKATLESLLKDASKREAQIQHNYHIIRERLTLAHISQLYLQAFELVLRNAR
jgi:glycosyltransferase involved in cell wall biosynthesis